jgi:hypothetical protein
LGDPKAEIEREITAAKNHTLQTNNMQQKYYRQTQKAGADYVNNMTIGHTISAF